MSEAKHIERVFQVSGSVRMVFFLCGSCTVRPILVPPKSDPAWTFITCKLYTVEVLELVLGNSIDDTIGGGGGGGGVTTTYGGEPFTALHCTSCWYWCF